MERIIDRGKVCARDILKRYETYYMRFLRMLSYIDDVGAIYFAVYRLNGQNTGRVFSSPVFSLNLPCAPSTLASSSLAKPHQRRVDWAIMVPVVIPFGKIRPMTAGILPWHRRRHSRTIALRNSTYPSLKALDLPWNPWTYPQIHSLSFPFPPLSLPSTRWSFSEIWLWALFFFFY